MVKWVVAVVIFSLSWPVFWSVAWWAFDTGPLSSQPALPLTQSSEVGAVRVYGDYRGLDDAAAATRTVAELEDAGGFERPVIVLMLPTGSGWVDPAQVKALEKWAGGDVALVSLRYSAAPSAVVYLLNPERARSSAHALLSEVGRKIAELPEPERPALVVQGLSLGAAAGEDVLEDLAAEGRDIPGLVSARLWQGLPGSAARDPAVDRCTLSVINTDDPVAHLDLKLLWDQGTEAIDTLLSLPGSDSRPPGSGHRYRPVLPPAGCVTGIDEAGSHIEDRF